MFLSTDDRSIIVARTKTKNVNSAHFILPFACFFSLAQRKACCTEHAISATRICTRGRRGLGRRAAPSCPRSPPPYTAEVALPPSLFFSSKEINLFSKGTLVEEGKVAQLLIDNNMIVYVGQKGDNYCLFIFILFFVPSRLT